MIFCVHVLSVLLIVSPTTAQGTIAFDSQLPAASTNWGQSGGLLGVPRAALARTGARTQPGSHVSVGSLRSPPTFLTSPLPRDSSWEGPEAPSQRTINSQVEKVLQKAVKTGPKDDSTTQGSSIRGRLGSKQSSVATEEKTTDGTTYIDYKNGRVYLSEKPLPKKTGPIVETHAQKMMSMAHANMDAIAKKDKTFADTLKKEAKQLKAAGMVAEGKALEREAEDLLDKLKKMIDNKQKAEQDKASINQRVAEVDKRLSRMKLHGSVVPHKKDIDELRDTSKKEVRKDVKYLDTSIYEYRNGSLWWSRETNSTILNATAGILASSTDAQKPREHTRHVSFINRPDSVVMSAQQSSARHAAQTDADTHGSIPGTSAHHAASTNTRAGGGSGKSTGGRDTSGHTADAKQGSGAKSSVQNGGGGSSRSIRSQDNSAAGGGALLTGSASRDMSGGPSSRRGKHSSAEGASGATTGARASFLKERQLSAKGVGPAGGGAGAGGAGAGGAGAGADSPSSLAIVGSIVAVLVLVVGAVYVKRLVFPTRKSGEQVPEYSSLDQR